MPVLARYAHRPLPRCRTVRVHGALDSPWWHCPAQYVNDSRQCHRDMTADTDRHFEVTVISLHTLDWRTASVIFTQIGPEGL